MSRNVKQGLSYSHGIIDVFLITLSVTFQIFYNQHQYFPSHKNNRRKKTLKEKKNPLVITTALVAWITQEIPTQR